MVTRMEPMTVALLSMHSTLIYPLCSTQLTFLQLNFPAVCGPQPRGEKGLDLS